MKKIIIGASPLVIAFALTLGYVTYNKTTSNALFLANLEALTNSENTEGGESSVCDVPGKVITIGPELAIICDYKNKTGGLTAGCKAKTGHTCTVQKSELPNLLSFI